MECPPQNSKGLLDHLFRRQAGRLVSCLAGRLGAPHLQLAEDAVQEAMLRAARLWPFQGVPEKPEAWLFQTAHHFAISALRRTRTFDNKSGELIALLEARTQHAEPTDTGQDWTEQSLRDDELRMVFICCHPDLAPNARVAMSLNLACGFSVGEIARIFLTSETAIAQRLVRAKRLLRERDLPLQLPDGKESAERLDSVLDVIYLMFSGGYAAHVGESLIHSEVCLEALRLGRLLASSSSMTAPRVDALVALMAFQAARLPARTDAAGDLALLDEQDRGLWDNELIAMGFYYFDRSIIGDEISPWHVQAAIASIYAKAARLRANTICASVPVLVSIDWPTILDHYDHLFQMTQSPVVALNRAVAVLKVHGPEAALDALDPLEQQPVMQGYHLLPAVRGRVLIELGRYPEAEAAYSAALACACSEPERRFLRRQLEMASSR